MRNRRTRKYPSAAQQIAEELADEQAELDEMQAEANAAYGVDEDGEEKFISPWITDDMVRQLEGFCDLCLGHIDLDDLLEIEETFPWKRAIDAKVQKRYNACVRRIEEEIYRLSQSQAS